MSEPIRVEAYKAEPTGDQRIPTAYIAVTAKLPDISGASLESARAWYDEQAKAIGDALSASLPGGTLDALLRYFLAEKASLFRVRMPRGER